MRWRGRSGAGAVAGGQRLLDIGLAPLAAADQLQGADQDAHLVVQERPRADLEMDLLAAPLDAQDVERLERGLGLAAGRAEAVEVVRADHYRSRGLYGLHVERH